MNFTKDNRIVLTLDAGGTNFVFSAIQGYKQIVEPIGLSAVSDNIEGCLDVLVNGFNQVISKLDKKPVAISFAFPGPADYEHGVIGDLQNFKAFRGGVALGPYLEEVFKIPVFINNDGNLFAYGEALAGMLPEVNAAFEAAGSKRRYKNLIGITFGTGFGGGAVINGTLLTGDNGCGGDVWCMRNAKHTHMIAEEGVSVRAVRRVYQELSGKSAEGLTPYDIFKIAEGIEPGDQEAARGSFAELGTIAGNGIANAVNIVDGIVAIGGGLCGAGKYIMPALVDALNSHLTTFAGERVGMIQMKAYNWEDEEQRNQFLGIDVDTVNVPRTDKTVSYLTNRATCVGFSKNGASSSIMYGAYAYALANL